MVSIEHQTYRKLAPESKDAKDHATDKGFDQLTVMQKLEIFEEAIAQSSGLFCVCVCLF